MSEREPGAVLSWGAGHTGALGVGPVEDRPEPRPIEGMPPARALAAGSTSAYAIDADGRVWSWGWDAFCHMLGRGMVEYPEAWLPTVLRDMGHSSKGRMSGDGGVGLPARVEGLPPTVQVATTSDTVYALTQSGEVWAWGDKSGLGRRARKDASRPQHIAALENVVQISASPEGHAAYALSEDRRVLSWGNGYEGELGHGKRRFDPVPQVVPSLERVKAVHASSFSALALLEDGTVWFWGNGQHIELTRRNTYRIKEPVQLEGFAGVRSLFAGTSVFIARTGAGETYVTGSGCSEMLGVENEDGEVVRAESLDAFETFSIGEDHGLALDAGGTLYSYGDAANGALGNGETEEQELFPPAPVPGLGEIVCAAAGNGYSLAIDPTPRT